MKDTTDIREFFEGSKTQFVIPLYQRKYSWDIDNCKRLFEDLIKIHRNNIKKHFFGSIVSVNADDTSKDLLIIDGQQRITTVSLILLAIINAVKNTKLSCNDNSLLNDITENYLIAKYKKNERNKKLCPIEIDRLAYDRIFDNDEKIFIKDSGITINYQFFYSQVIYCGLLADEIFEAIERLSIVDLVLERQDNPQLIFESLNSTGKDLNEADKIRNYLLMNLSKSEQEEYYTKYWAKIEEYTDREPTMFFRDYLTVYTRTIYKIDNLYFDFKSYYENKISNKEDFLKNLLKYATFYKRVIKCETKQAKINKKLKQLANIGSNVGMPFYMSFFDYADTNSLDEKEVWNVLDIIENFWARRIICSYNTNALSKLFSTLHNEILKIINNHDKRNIPVNVPYSELLKYLLLKKQGSSAFPTDEEVKECFRTKNIYNMNKDYQSFLFERMENENSNEGISPVVEEMKEGKITIEHVMPKTLTSQWKKDLGDDWEATYNTYLNKFANLTLTGYNQNYSNKAFVKKLNGFSDKEDKFIPGFKESRFHLSNYIKQCSKWTKEELEEREAILSEKVFKLWPMITSEYTQLDADVEEISLFDEDVDLTRRKLKAFSYKGEKYETSSWKDMMVDLLQILYKEDTASVIYLANKQYWLYTTCDDYRTKIEDECYVHSHNSTKTKMDILHYVFNNLNIPETDLTFYLTKE